MDRAIDLKEPPRIAILVLSASVGHYPELERELWSGIIADARMRSDIDVYFLRASTSQSDLAASRSLITQLNSGRGNLDRLAKKLKKFPGVGRLFLSVCRFGAERLAKHAGISDRVALTGNSVLEVSCPEDLALCGYKTLAAFKWLENRGYTHVYRTNSSSFINLDKLANVVSGLPASGLYAGAIGRYLGQNFVSGSGILLSIDVVVDAINGEKFWNHYLMDDVALARTLHMVSPDTYPLPLQRVDLPGIPEIVELSASEFRENLHFRLKGLNAEDTVMNAEMFRRRVRGFSSEE